MIISGIYKITCVPTKQIYIGSSHNIIQRWYGLTLYDHTYHTYTGANQPMRNALLEFGIDAFTFEILELTAPENLQSRELYWIRQTKCTDPTIGFNVDRNAIRALGYNCKPKNPLQAAMRQFGAIAIADYERLTQSK